MSTEHVSKATSDPTLKQQSAPLSGEPMELPAAPMHFHRANIVDLQRLVGNQGVQHILKQNHVDNTGQIRRQRTRRIQLNMPQLITNLRSDLAAYPDLSPLVRAHPIGGSVRFSEGARHGVQSNDVEIARQTQQGINHIWFLRIRWFELPSAASSIAAAMTGSGPQGAGDFSEGTDNPRPGGSQEHHRVINIDLNRPDLAAALRAPGANPGEILENAARQTLLHELIHLSINMHRTMGTTPASGTVAGNYQTRLARANSAAMTTERTQVTNGINALINLAELALRTVLEQNAAASGATPAAPIQPIQYALFPTPEYADRQAYLNRRIEILVEEQFAGQTADHRANADLARSYAGVVSQSVDSLAELKSYRLRTLYAPQNPNFNGIRPSQQTAGGAWGIALSNLTTGLTQFYNALDRPPTP